MVWKGCKICTQFLGGENRSIPFNYFKTKFSIPNLMFTFYHWIIVVIDKKINGRGDYPAGPIEWPTYHFFLWASSPSRYTNHVLFRDYCHLKIYFYSIYEIRSFSIRKSFFLCKQILLRSWVKLFDISCKTFYFLWNCKWILYTDLGSCYRWTLSLARKEKNQSWMQRD